MAAEAIVTVLLGQLGAFVQQPVSARVKFWFNVEEEVRHAKDKLSDIQRVLDDAERRRLEDKNENPIKSWLQKVEDVSYEYDDVLDEWLTRVMRKQIDKDAAAGVAAAFATNFRRTHKWATAKKLKELNETFDRIAKEKDQLDLRVSIRGDDDFVRQDFRPVETTSLLDESEIYGRDSDKESLVSELLLYEDSEPVSVVSIVGTGGLGKTTVAKQAFNDFRIKSHFDHTIWVCVSDSFDAKQVARKIIESLSPGGGSADLPSLDLLQKKILELCSNKRVLFVLDDVWPNNRRYWDDLKTSLKDSSPGTKVLVTTRDKKVAEAMGSSHLQELSLLSDEDCWKLVCGRNHSKRSDADWNIFSEIGLEISKKCRGLPIAAKTIGRHLHYNRRQEEWEKILNNEIWRLPKVEDEVFRPLMLSYSHLPAPLRHCFRYCSVFPKDYRIDSREVVKMWMAQGYIVKERAGDSMEMIGYSYIKKLVMFSFFQEVIVDDLDDDKIESFKIHGVLHDFAQYLMRNECLKIENNSPPLPDSRKFRHLTLLRSFDQASPDDDLASILTSHRFRTLFANNATLSYNNHQISSIFEKMIYARVLSLRNCRLERLPAKMEMLIHLRYLNLSYNLNLVELPEDICDLCNLESLNLAGCIKLSKLPPRVEKLVNLGHLSLEGTDELRKLPEGIRKLRELQTLDKFVFRNNESLRFGDLKHLTKLGGKLFIHLYDQDGAGFTTDDWAALENNVRIEFLHFYSEAIGMTSNLLEYMKSPPMLRGLKVSRLHYSRSFILQNFSQVKTLILSECSYLPDLWELPFLERLEIISMDYLRKLTLGSAPENPTAATSTYCKPPAGVLFPRLKILRFANCLYWKNWIYNREETMGSSVMPRLEELKVQYCERLKGLPHSLLSELNNLKRLNITGSTYLLELYGENDDQSRLNKFPWLNGVTVDTVSF